MTNADVSTWNGRTAFDRHGEKLGKIADLYVDDTTGDPEWLAVHTGLFGARLGFVPLEGATLRGDDVIVAHDKATVKDAPHVDADGRLTPDEERRLYGHYGRPYGMTGDSPAANGVRGDAVRER